MSHKRLTESYRLNMSSVNVIYDLRVTTSLPLDCSSASSAWIRSNGQYSTTVYSCAGQGIPPQKKPISEAVKFGIGFGVAFFFVFLVLFIIGWRKFHKKPRASVASTTKPPAYEMEPLPVYRAAADLGSETHLQNERGAERVSGEGSGSANGHEEEVDTREVVQ